MCCIQKCSVECYVGTIIPTDFEMLYATTLWGMKYTPIFEP